MRRLATTPDTVPPSEDALALSMRRLRMRHLEVLLSIAHHQSLTAAAQALNATQPAVSQWLGEIEAALGRRLFLRGRQIRPTPHLAPVLWHARRMVNDSHRLARELNAIDAGDAGIVRIGAMQVAGPRVVPQLILSLRSQGASVRIEVVEDIAAGLWPRFDRRELDLLIARLDARAFGPDVQCEALHEDQHQLLVARGHPLRRLRRGLTWARTQRFPWILPPTGTPLRQAIDASFVTRALAPPTPWVESAALSANLALVERTDALCVVSGAVARHAARDGRLATLPLSLDSEIGPVGMVWHDRSPSAAVLRVLETLRALSQRGELAG